MSTRITTELICDARALYCLRTWTVELGQSVAEARASAAREGWTREGRSGDRCPAHPIRKSPEEKRS